MENENRVKTPILIADLKLMVAWMGRFLLSPAGEASPNRDTFIGMMEEVRALAEGACLTEYGFCCALSIKHYMAIGGIPHVEAFPGDAGRDLALLLPLLDRRKGKRVNRA